MKKATSLFRSHKIECKESSIEGAGLGIFATEDIKAGEEIFTNYHGSSFKEPKESNI